MDVIAEELLSPFYCVGGEGLQSTGKSWPSDVGAEHGAHTGGALGAPAWRSHCTDSI